MKITKRLASQKAGYCVALVTCIGILTQQFAVPLHLALENHSWGSVASVEAHHGGAHQHHRHHYHHHHHHHVGHNSSLAPSVPAHLPHSAEDHLNEGSLEPARIDSPRPAPAKVALIPGVVEIATPQHGVSWLFDPPRLEPPILRHLYSSRAPPQVA